MLLQTMVLDCFQCTNQKWINYILEQWLEKKATFKAVCDARGPKSCLKLGQRAKKSIGDKKLSLPLVIFECAKVHHA